MQQKVAFSESGPHLFGRLDDDQAGKPTEEHRLDSSADIHWPELNSHVRQVLLKQRQYTGGVGDVSDVLGLPRGS
jgi:hypothetical protein